MSEAGAVDVAALLDTYRGTLLTMHDERVEAGGQPRRWNRLVDRLQALHLVLRAEPAGRVGVADLLGDPNTTVRLWAATHALFWAEPAARNALEREASGRGLHAMEAQLVLREFDAGRLDVTWHPRQPKRSRP